MKLRSGNAPLKIVGAVVVAVLAIATGLVAVVVVLAGLFVVLLVRAFRRRFGSPPRAPAARSPVPPTGKGEVIEVTAVEVKDGD